MDTPQSEFPAALQTFLDSLPLPIIVYTLDGTLCAINTSAETMWNLRRDECIGVINVFSSLSATVVDAYDTFARVQRGEMVVREPTQDQTGLTPEDSRLIWYQALIFPIRTLDQTITHVGYIYRDVTNEIEQQQRIVQSEESIAAQQLVIQELAIPVVRIWEGILLAPLVGSIDARRAALVTEHLLETIVQSGADVVILDVTGVSMIDTSVANYLVNTARAVHLLGASIALTGIRSEIAQAVVQLGIDFEQFKTHSNLQAGLAWAFAKRRLQVTSAS